MLWPIQQSSERFTAFLISPLNRFLLLYKVLNFYTLCPNGLTNGKGVTYRDCTNLLNSSQIWWKTNINVKQIWDNRKEDLNNYAYVKCLTLCSNHCALAAAGVYEGEKKAEQLHVFPERPGTSQGQGIGSWALWCHSGLQSVGGAFIRLSVLPEASRVSCQTTASLCLQDWEEMFYWHEIRHVFFFALPGMHSLLVL